MKKLIKIVVMAITFFSLINKSFAMQNIEIKNCSEPIHVHKKDSDLTKELKILKSTKTNEAVYSLDFSENIKSGAFNEISYLNEKLNNKISKDTWEYLKTLTYLGYGASEKSEEKWYIVTQMMVWRKLLKEDEELYFVNEKNEKIELYNEEIKTLEKEIEEASILPSFAGKLNADYTVSKKVEANAYLENALIDENQVLDKFKVDINDTKGYVKIDQNKLYFKTVAANSTVMIHLSRAEAGGSSNILYKEDAAFLLTRNHELVHCFVAAEMKLPIIAIKLHSKVNLSLANTTYEIYNESGNVIRTLTTNESGEAHLTEGLYKGNYILKEKEASKGYIKNTEEIPFQIEGGNFTFELLKTPINKPVTISLLKKDVELELYDKKSNELIQSLKSDSNGDIHLSLHYGTYLLRSKKDTNIQIKDFEFLVNEDSIDSYELETFPTRGTLTITLIEKENLNPVLEKFQIKLTNTKTKESTYHTVLNGVLKLENILLGNYQIEEINVPKQYHKITTQNIELSKDNLYMLLDIPHEKKTATLIIEKLDATTLLPIKDVSFLLYNKEKEMLGTYTTNESGIIEISDLAAGEYYIKESYDEINNARKIILEEGIKSTLTFQDRLKIEVPNTSSNEYVFLLLEAIVSVCLGVFYVQKNHKNT